MKVESLSHSARTILLARIAHWLTVCARYTYEPGTENILEPRVLRAYNELMHRVTSSIRAHVEGDESFPLEAVLEMMREFGTTFNRSKDIEWALKMAQERPLPTVQ
jgi:hypothetical protein